MAKTQRWGDTFIDRRNWPVYSEQLVKRGEYLLDLEFIAHWQEELKQMNEGKRGAPYLFPNSLIDLQAVWHGKAPYRMVEGITRQLAIIGKLPDYNDYSTINRRVNRLDCRLDLPQGDSLTIFSDGTSLCVVEGGEYLREKYGKKNRRWVQVVIFGDPVTKEPVSFEVNIVQDSELASAKSQLAELQRQGAKIECLGGDGAYDEIAFWNWLVYRGIEPIIKPDKNAIVPSGSRERDKNVKERNDLGFGLWSTEHRYGYRWPATEGIFSAVKRIFGEKIHARTDLGMVQEAKIKFWAYQKIKRYGEAQPEAAQELCNTAFKLLESMYVHSSLVCSNQ